LIGRTLSGALLVVLLAACQPAASDATTYAAPLVAAPSGLAQVPLTVSGQGKPRRFMVEVAATPDEQQRGLMFRQSLAPDAGMIFPMPRPEVATFWMKDTLIPLDLIFIRADGRIANIVADATPMSLAMISASEPVTAVLEIAGGRAAQLDIRPGDKVSWPK